MISTFTFPTATTSSKAVQEELEILYLIIEAICLKLRLRLSFMKLYGRSQDRFPMKGAPEKTRAALSTIMIVEYSPLLIRILATLVEIDDRVCHAYLA